MGVRSMARRKMINLEKLQLDLESYQKTQSLIVGTVVGQVASDQVADRVLAVADRVPLAPILWAVVVQARARLAELRERADAGTHAWLEEVIYHNDLLCRTQGSLTVLLLVGEQGLRSVPVLRAKPQSRKKSS